MTAWPHVKLSSLADFRNGLNFAADARGKGLAIVGVRDFQDRTFVRFDELEELNPDALSSNESLIAKNDILFVRSNGNRELIGRSLFVHETPSMPTSHSGFTIRLRFTNRRAFPKFFAYLLRSDVVRRSLSSRGGGTSINNLSQGILGNLDVALPPLWEQQRIAEILGAYDDAIEVNRRRLGLLEDMNRCAFLELVARPFGGVPAVSGLDPSRGSLLGWKKVTLADMANLIMGQSPPSSDLNMDGVGLSFHQGVSNFGRLYPTRRVSCAVARPGKTAAIGDVLFSVRAPVGRINIANEPTVLGRGVAAIRSRNNRQHFLAAHLMATFHKIDLIGNGSIYKAVNRGDLERVPMIQPPPELCEQVDRWLGHCFQQLQVLDRSNQRLASSRDLLLPRLISGHLSVAEAELELEQAA